MEMISKDLVNSLINRLDNNGKMIEIMQLKARDKARKCYGDKYRQEKNWNIRGDL